MALQPPAEDLPPENTSPPCAVCGKPSGCEAWGFPLCYGDVQAKRLGCVTRLNAVMPFEGEKEFTIRWVAKARKKASAA